MNEVSDLNQDQMLSRYSRLYLVISKINQLVIRSKNRDEVFAGACKIAAEEGQYKMAWIGLINKKTLILEPVAWAGVEEGYLTSIDPIKVDYTSLIAGPSSTAIREGRPDVIYSIEEPRFSPWREQARKRGYGSIISLPISSGRKVIGAFNIYASKPNSFNVDEVRLLEEMTSNISFALNSLEKERVKEKTEKDFRTIFEKAPLGIALIDSFNGKIYDLNGEYARIAGRSIEEMKTLDWMTFTHPDDILPDLKNMEDMNSGKTNGFKMEKRYLLPNSDIVWVHMSIVPFDINEHGRPRHLCMVEDITDRKRIDEDLKSALKLRDEFLMLASHELKTPVTTIQILMHSLKKNAQKIPEKNISDDVLSKVEKTSKQSDRLNLLIQGLLDVTKMSTGAFAMEVTPGADLSQLAADVISKIEPDFQKDNVALNVTIAPNLYIDCDTLRIEQVLINLLSNALKYGGKKPVFFEVLPIKENVRVVVKDQGIGVPMDKQALIFERFERAMEDHKYKGLGLGLWIAKSIIEAHYGKIWVESKFGEGSQFIVELPRERVKYEH